MTRSRSSFKMRCTHAMVFFALLAIPAVSQNRRGQLISTLKWDVLPGNILHPALGIIRGLSFCTAFWTYRPTACRTGELTAPVRVTHPFHPLFGQSIDFRRTADSMG